MSGSPGGRVLLVAPHADDIAYSAAAHLLAGRLEPRSCVLLTVFTVSTFAPYSGVTDRAAITALRGEEDARFAAALGVRRMTFDMAEAPIRDGIERVQGLFIEDRGAARHPFRDTLRRAFMAVLTQGAWEQIVIPLGIGGHVDHLLVRDVVREIAPDGAQLRLYEDLPYAGQISERKYLASVAALTAGLEAELVPETGWLPRKLELLALYESQVAPKDLASVRRAVSRIGGERSWLDVPRTRTGGG